MIHVRAHYTCEVGQEKNEDNNFRWVLPYKDPCRCTKVRYGGLNAFMPKRPFKPVNVEKPLVGDNVGEIRDHYDVNCIDMTCPIKGSVEGEADPGNATGMITWQTKAIDNNGEPLSVVCDPRPNVSFPIGHTDITCLAEDQKGNNKSCTFDVSVIDNEAPECDFNLQNPMERSTDAGKPNVTIDWLMNPIAHDNSGIIPNITCNYTSGTQFTIGETVVNCTAVDDSGNSRDCQFKVTVFDNEAPAFDFSPQTPMERNTDAGQPTATIDWPVAYDNSGGIPNITCNYTSGAQFAIGKTAVKCTAVDDSGNKKECQFKVNVFDMEAPEFNFSPQTPMKRNTDAGQPTATIDWPIAYDNSGRIPQSTCNFTSGAQFAIGETAVNCTAVDDSGNKKECQFKVNVFDMEAPEFNFSPQTPMKRNTDAGQPTATIDWPIAHDNSGRIPQSTCNYTSGTQFAIGETAVNCTAVDDSGNKKDCQFKVIVFDIEAPEFNFSRQTPMKRNTDAGQPTATIDWPIAHDNSGRNPQIMCNYTSGTQFAIGETEVNCTAVDDSGNKKECQFKVNVFDNEAPTFEFSPQTPMVRNTDAGQPTATIDWPIAHDNSGRNPNIACSYASGAQFNIGETAVNCTAVDDSGNKKDCHFKVNVFGIVQV
ncbi:hyalin-like [Amphiura filiformis]|uniref:hyalin-like n=1 Tax=Amphiura filiformis TaxID=82378 RepID=UPI003B225BE4